MKRLFQQIIIYLTLGTLCLSAPFSAFANTYGSGAYGNCKYGQGCDVQPSVNPLSSTINSAGNAIAVFFCTDQAPSSAPNLYQIDVKDTTATLYFSPAGGPYNKHYVAYGKGNNSEGNGAEFSTNASKGALTYEVKQLTLGNIYTFKVRGGNGCKPGQWSNTLTIKMQTKGSKAIAKFYPKQQARYVQAKPVSWTNQAKTFISNLIPRSIGNTGLGGGEKKDSNYNHSEESAKNAQQNQKQTNSSLWGKVTNWFENLFH